MSETRHVKLILPIQSIMSKLFGTNRGLITLANSYGRQVGLPDLPSEEFIEADYERELVQDLFEIMYADAAGKNFLYDTYGIFQKGFRLTEMTSNRNVYDFTFVKDSDNG